MAATTPCGQSYCAQVNYSYAITGGQPPYSLICNLASGSLFLVGSHAISCFGQDSADNSTPEASFVITVDPPSTGGGGGSGITADITGCTQPTCMGNSLSFFQLDGCQCDFGPFNGNRMSYSLATPAPAGAIAPPVTIHTGNQTNDVSIMFSANGVPVGVASTSASGQQSGIDYTSDPIALVPGKNLLSLTVDDPLHRLAAATYTWAFDYSPPTTTTGSATSPVPGSRSSNGSGSAASSASPSNASAPATAGLTRGSVSKPAIVLAKGGQHMLSFSVRLATAALVHVALTARSGKTLVRFSVRATKGRTLVRRHLPAPAARHGSRLTLRLTLRVHGKEQRVAVAFTA